MHPKLTDVKGLNHSSVALLEAALDLIYDYEDGTGQRSDSVIAEVAKAHNVDPDELAEDWYRVSFEEGYRSFAGMRSMREILKEQKA